MIRLYQTLALVMVWLCICIILLYVHKQNHMERLENIIEEYNKERALIYKGEINERK